MTILQHIRQKAREKGFPIEVVIELNRSCNLRCGHCYHGEFDYNRLSAEQLAGVWPQLASLGTLNITLTGGEILVHPELETILTQAREYRFMVTMISNLTLATPEMVKKWRELGVSLVRTSIYFASAAEHDAFVKREGAFAKTLAALDLLYSEGIATKIQVTLMENNLGQIAAIEKLAVEHHAQCAGVYFLDPINGTNNDNAELMPTAATLQQARLAQPDSRLLGPWMAQRTCGSGPCGAALSSAFIDAGGGFWPCINWPEPVGQIADGNLPALWYGARMTAIREELAKCNGCSDCQKRKFCNPCAALNLRANGSIGRPYAGRCFQAGVYEEVWG